MRRLSLTAFSLALMMVVPVTSARAADPKASNELGVEGTWSSQCEIDRMTDFKSCRAMAYRTFDDGDKKTVIALSVVPTGNDYHLIISTNIGLMQGCAIRVDRQPRIESYVAAYNMCMFPNFLSARTADQFKNGASVLVRLTQPRGVRRDLDFPLNGFSKAFDEMQRTTQ